MVALHESVLMMGGKSELRRAGWSVTRTVSLSRDKESATEKKPPRDRLGRFAGKG